MTPTEHKGSNKEAESNTVRRSKDEPDALDTTPRSEPMAEQPKKPEPKQREDKRLKELGDAESE